jgi:hypothetical protein
MPGTTYDDTTAAPGTTYDYYVVAALDDTGYRANKGGSDTGWRALPPPANVAASDGTYSYVRVTWTGAKYYYYRVYRSTSLDGEKQSVSGWISPAPPQGYNDTSAASAVFYWYWVQAATTIEGKRPSDYSAPDTGWWGLLPQHTLTVSNGSGSGTYDEGSQVPIVANVPAGYRFDRWTGDTANVANVSAASTTITMLADATVTATFVRQYTLTVSNGTGSGVYDTGSAVPIQATVPAGYRFDRWTGATVANATSASTTIVMTADATVTATFVRQYKLTVVVISTEVPLGWVFGRWTGDVTYVANVMDEPTTIRMLSDATVTANNIQVQYELTVINGTGSGVYGGGTLVDIAANPPQSGYYFRGWTGDIDYVENTLAPSTTVLVVAGTTLGATYARQLVVDLSVAPSAQFLQPGHSGQFYFDLVVDPARPVQRCNGLTLWSIITKNGAGQSDVTFDHAELGSGVIDAVTAIGGTLIDVTVPGEDMISYMISPPNPNDYGPLVAGQVARFYYNHSAAAHGRYEIGIDQTPMGMGDIVWSTRTAFGRGTALSVDWIPKWLAFGDQRVDYHVLDFRAGAITFGVRADVSGDDCVNVIDLLTVRNNLGKAGSLIFPPAADVDGDGICNVADLLIVRNRLGNGCR